MYNKAERASIVAVLYFLSFYVLSVLVIANLLTAVVFEVFLSISRRREAKDKRAQAHRIAKETQAARKAARKAARRRNDVAVASVFAAASVSADGASGCDCDRLGRSCACPFGACTPTAPPRSPHAVMLKFIMHAVSLSLCHGVVVM